MKESHYKSYDDLPLFLNAKTVAKVLGVSPSSGYELLHDPGFPVMRVGNRMVVPKEQFIQWRWNMKYRNYRDVFFLPNELFQLGLDYGELAVYSFLKRCKNRKTHQCWHSIKTIGHAVGMSENTVRKCIRRLEER